jgi:Polyphosphate kinase 2 (PPK2)
MKASDFSVVERPRLLALTKHPKIASEDHEHRLQSMPSTMQPIQQEYLGTRTGSDRSRRVGHRRQVASSAARLGNGSAKLQGLPDCRVVVAERGKHHLQRFWEKLPEPVQIIVFDRSWHGRVLVDRVEGFANKQEWQRGYEEINQFERMMVADGIRLVNAFYTPLRRSRSGGSRIGSPTRSNAGSFPMRTSATGPVRRTTMPRLRK